MTTGKALVGKPYAGNPHVRFDEGEAASCTAEATLRRVHCRRQPEGRASVCAATPRRGSLLYKTKTILAAMMAAAFLSVAFADGTTLTWNGADGASWTTGENWLNGETPSAWVDGANAVFPSAATVTLNGAVTVSNLTAAGAVTFAGTIVASYGKFVTPSSTLAFTGLKLSDITTIDGQMGGGNFGATPRVEAHAYHYTCDGDEATAQFQCPYGLDLRVVRIKLTEKADGIYVQTVGKSGYVSMGSSANAVNSLGCDADALGIKWDYSIATSDDYGAYGVCDLRVSDSSLNLIGAASFGGTATFSNVAFNVTAPIAQTWNQQIVMQNGTLTVKGASDATIDTKYGLTGSETGNDSAWLTATASDTVFTNMVLARTLPVQATLKGSYIGIGEEYTQSLPYHVKFDGRTMTCQFQFHYNNYMKGVKVEFTQDGADVKARWVMGYNHYDTDGAVLGEDMESASGTTTQSDYRRYAVKNMTLRTVEVPSLTLGSTVRASDLIVDNAHLWMEGTSSSTYLVRCLTAKNGAVVAFGDGQNNSNSGEGCVRRFESGSFFSCIGSLRTNARAKYVFDASCVCLPQDHGTQHDGNNYLCDVTFANGGMAVGNPLRCGYYNASNVIEWVSAGAAVNTNAAGINLCYHNYNGDTAATNTVVLRTDADFAVTGRIYDSPNWPGALLVKRGAAKLTLSGNNTFAGRFTIEAGTVALGSNTALPASAPLTLAGGTVTCGTFANATGALTLSGDATIDLGDGSLSFADSSGETWAAGATLNITGTDSLPTRTLRFGTDSSGLTPAQLKQIRYNGGKVSLNSEGYLSGPKGLIISFY